MQLGMIGLGRMGANLARRAMRDGHRCVVHDRNADAVRELADDGAIGAGSIAEMVAELNPPRTVWVMVPAGPATTGVIEEVGKHLGSGDIVIDGGNTYYRDDLRHAEVLARSGVRLLDCGTSGGVRGLERGYCLMIGGDDDAVTIAEPIFASLAPGSAAAERTPGRSGHVAPEEIGYLHCGPSGAGHFVKMVHNGIEYGMMAALAEGLDILHHADIGCTDQQNDAETAPLRDPEFYRYDVDMARVAEVWRRGSVIGSWLLDLTAAALLESPNLNRFTSEVADSGEGRWTSIAAIDEGVPTPVLTAALYSRFSSRGLDEYAGKTIAAMREQFGGHAQ